jgi:hypothetical protein
LDGGDSEGHLCGFRLLNHDRCWAVAVCLDVWCQGALTSIFYCRRKGEIEILSMMRLFWNEV